MNEHENNTLQVCESNTKRAEALLRSYNALCVNAKIAQERVKTIDRALATLAPEEQLILHRMFMDAVEWKPEDVAFELNVERSTYYRMRKTALKKLAIALYGCDI